MLITRATLKEAITFLQIMRIESDLNRTIENGTSDLFYFILFICYYRKFQLANQKLPRKLCIFEIEALVTFM